MFQEPPLEKKWHSWLFFFSWTLFILRLAPLTRPILSLITQAVGRDMLVYITIGVTAVAGFLGVRYIIRNPRLRSKRSVIALTAVVAAYTWICLHELQAPQEALHFLEYGFLGLLAFRALSHHMRDAAIYPAAVLMCALVANADEILQWLTPNRYWDLRDWGWDIAAAALAQVTIAGGMRPLFVAWRTERRSWMVVLRLLAAQILLMGLCLSTTPARCVRLGSTLPWLRSLTWQENVMTEYGFLHADPEFGSFFSRFSLDDLKRLDDTRYEDAATIIKTYRDGPGFDVFCREVNSGVDPFTHEAYVHISRRNHYLMASYKYKERDKDLYAYHCRVAFRENQILEKYFPRTTGFAGETMPTDQFDRLRHDMVEKRPYRSPVSDHLITEFTEKQVRLFFALALLLVVAVDIKQSRHA